MNSRLRDSAPLLDAYLSYFETQRTAFTIPGHKQKAHRLDEGLGAVVDSDTPLYGGLDEIKLTEGTLKKAEELAASLWGADYARFSTGGSTHANQAIILALGKPGDKVAITRTAHRSVLSALVLTGLEPIWLTPDIDEATGVPTGIPVAELERVLDQKPIALLLTEPGYLGTISELPALISKAHENSIPVIIDAAWGGHFGFNANIPQHVMQLGADALITSVHKALPGYSASALLLAQGKFLNLARIEQSFETTHTTSPAGAPLVVLGPGGDFTEHVFERAGRLTVERPACHTMQEIETDADPFSAQAEHITARSRRHRLSRFLSESAEEIAVLDVSPRTAPVITLNENESNESHTQAAAHLRIHPSAPRAQGLLTNDAGDRRLTRRHQGDGVRTRRSAHQEGRAGARSEQESLFVDR